MSTAFRIGLALALGAVSAAALLVATAPRCYTLVAIVGTQAYVFDECMGVVHVQTLDTPKATPL